MTTLWVHCGAMTTSCPQIQNCAYEGREKLRELGWLYPETGLVTNEPQGGFRHSRLAYLLHQPTRWEVEVDKLIEEIAFSSCDQVILSTDAWSKPNGIQALGLLLERLREAKAVDEAHAVIYLRNRADYARQVFRDMTRRRGNQSQFRNFVNNRPLIFDPVVILSQLHDLFGHRLNVRNFDRVRSAPLDFFNVLGIKPPSVIPPESAEEWDAIRVAAQRHITRHARGLTAPPTQSILPGQPARMYGESLGAKQFETNLQWLETFARLSGWPEDQVNEFVGPGKPFLRDVEDADRLIGAAVEDWLLHRRVPKLQVNKLATTQHWDAQVSFANPADFSQIALSGRVLLPDPIARLWWVPSRPDEPRVGLTIGLPSPQLAQRFDLPQAGQARFEGSGLELLAGRSAAIVAETSTGTVGLAKVTAEPRA